MDTAVIPALLGWCRALRTLEFPELDLPMARNPATSEHYR
jgi:hypothetical protein